MRGKESRASDKSLIAEKNLWALGNCTSLLVLPEQEKQDLQVQSTPETCQTVTARQ